MAYNMKGSPFQRNFGIEQNPNTEAKPVSVKISLTKTGKQRPKVNVPPHPDLKDADPNKSKGTIEGITQFKSDTNKLKSKLRNTKVYQGAKRLATDATKLYKGNLKKKYNAVKKVRRYFTEK